LSVDNVIAVIINTAVSFFEATLYLSHGKNCVCLQGSPAHQQQW